MSTTRVVLGAAALVLAAALTACVPEPTVGPGEVSTEPPSTTAPEPTRIPSPTATPTGTELPADCAGAYSAEMFASLEQVNPPLNDPGVMLLATQNAALLEALETVPTLRCSWGPPGDTGLTTNISVVDTVQHDAIIAELANSGYGCAEEDGAQVCTIEQRGVSLEEVPYTRGETHALQGDLWVATNWVNFTPDGYTQDILATLGA